MKVINQSLLGKATIYPDRYDPNLLYPIDRNINRKIFSINFNAYYGVDIWNGYEFSWLDKNGIPINRKITIYIASNSKNLIESKSFKLYLYSFANTSFSSEQIVKLKLKNDITKAINGSVKIQLDPIESELTIYRQLPGENIDDIAINCHEYNVNPNYLILDNNKSNDIITETLCSELLKSNCLVTGKPDWGSVSIKYTGQRINRAGLLKYLISFREHNEFHEHCVERIFADIMTYCKPEQLMVKACYTRRGGLDINPIRTTIKEKTWPLIRLFRQ